jgi:hypothetical protein
MVIMSYLNWLEQKSEDIEEQDYSSAIYTAASKLQIHQYQEVLHLNCQSATVAFIAELFELDITEVMNDLIKTTNEIFETNLNTLPEKVDVSESN